MTLMEYIIVAFCAVDMLSLGGPEKKSNCKMERELVGEGLGTLYIRLSAKAKQSQLRRICNPWRSYGRIAPNPATFTKITSRLCKVNWPEAPDLVTASHRKFDNVSHNIWSNNSNTSVTMQ